MMTKRAPVVFCLLGILLTVLFSACVLPDFALFQKAGNQEMVSISTDRLTLLWDPPPGDVAHFTVYFRVHGASDWVSLADVPAGPTPEYTVAHTATGDGEFDFAVVAVDASDQKSAYHTSLDTTAQPQTGWYVSWYVP